MQSDRYITVYIALGLFLMLLLFPEASVSQVRGAEAKADEDSVFVRDPELKNYFPARYQSLFSPFPRKKNKLIAIQLQDDRTVSTLDSLSLRYTVLRSVKGLDVFYPINYDFATYTYLSKRSTLKRNWSKLIQESNLRREEQRGLLDFRINIPGGERSAFTTIFGKNELNLQVRGTANMTLGASIQETDNPSLTETERRRIDPLFTQNLKLNIQGTIGDKLKIGTDWDSERMFDFENRLKLVYECYDDEIIRTIDG